jgi:hypothetical protein
VFHKNGVKFSSGRSATVLCSNGCQLSWYAYLGILQRNPGLDLAPAHGAGCVTEQPAVDARQVERVAAHRQAPRGFTGLKLLRKQSSVETGGGNTSHGSEGLASAGIDLEANRTGDVLAAGIHVVGEPHHRDRVDGRPRHAAGAAGFEDVGAVTALPDRVLHRAHLQQRDRVTEEDLRGEGNTSTGRREHVGTRTWLSTALSTAGSTFSRTRRPVSRLQMTPSW